MTASTDLTITDAAASPLPSSSTNAWHYSGSRRVPAETVMSSLSSADEEYAAALDVQFTDKAKWRSAEHQGRLLTLAAAKAGAAGEPVPAKVVDGPGGPALVTGLKDALQTTGSWAGLAASFDRLPAAAAHAVSAELSAPAPTRNGRATAETLDRLARDDAGRICLQHWGRDAPRLAGLVCQRTQRLFARLMHDQTGWRALSDWFDGLDAVDAATIMKGLAR